MMKIWGIYCLYNTKLKYFCQSKRFKNILNAFSTLNFLSSLLYINFYFNCFHVFGQHLRPKKHSYLSLSVLNVAITISHLIVKFVILILYILLSLKKHNSPEITRLVNDRQILTDSNYFSNNLVSSDIGHPTDTLISLPSVKFKHC